MFAALSFFFFDPTVSHFPFVERSSWFNIFNINCISGSDGLALIMVILTAFLIPICIALC
jgi:NADH:ubiquinone oxidoreductase subunit 4 (subunit M)